MKSTRDLHDLLKLDNYTSEGKVEMKLTIPSDEDQAEMPDPVSVPRSIARRLHYLGMAYDLEALKLLRPQGMLRVDWTWMQRLISELDFVERATKDPVIHHYLAEIRPVLVAGRAITGSVIILNER